MRKLRVLALVLVVAFGVAILSGSTQPPARGGRAGSSLVIYVYGQELFYDSIVTADPLPPKGPFQLLESGGPASSGLQTEFGPGDSEYRGGRWVVETDDGPHYFSCPLLGPGRPVE